MPREINAAGYRLIKEFEAGPLGNSQPALTPYRCPAGRLTNGWGNTHGVRPGVTITLAQAEADLARNLDWAEACVERYATAPNENEFAAMVSLCFNIGPDAGAGFPSSTVLRLHNRGDKAGAAAAFAMWRKMRDPGTGGLVDLGGPASPPQHRGQLVSDAGRRSACNADAAVCGAGEVHPVEQDRDRRRLGGRHRHGERSRSDQSGGAFAERHHNRGSFSGGHSQAQCTGPVGDGCGCRCVLPVALYPEASPRRGRVDMIAIALPWKIAIGATLMTVVLGAMWWAFSEGKARRAPTISRTPSQHNGASPMRTLVALALLTTSTAGCATAVSSACPREVEYSVEQQRQAADELSALPRDGMVRAVMMPDYGRLRDQARACRRDAA